MLHFNIPNDYKSLLTLRETEVAIKKVKDFFERQLAVELNLTRVSAHPGKRRAPELLFNRQELHPFLCRNQGKDELELRDLHQGKNSVREAQRKGQGAHCKHCA